MANYYLGTIKEVLDPDLYHIKVDIPGLAKEVEAFPIRGELDEPRVGDQVIIRDLDPIFHSFYLYSEVKEDNFIGIRSRGKIVELNQEEIRVGIFDPSEKYEEKASGVPNVTTWIKVDKDGNIEISAEKDITVKAEKDAQIEAKNITIKADNMTEIKGFGSTFKVKGGANIACNGPFCSIPVCPILGTPHTTPTVKIV